MNVKAMDLGVPIILAGMENLGCTLLGYLHVGVHVFVASLAESRQNTAGATKMRLCSFHKDLANNATKSSTMYIPRSPTSPVPVEIRIE